MHVLRDGSGEVQGDLYNAFCAGFVVDDTLDARSAALAVPGAKGGPQASNRQQPARLGGTYIPVSVLVVQRKIHSPPAEKSMSALGLRQLPKAPYAGQPGFAAPRQASLRASSEHLLARHLRCAEGR